MESIFKGLILSRTWPAPAWANTAHFAVTVLKFSRAAGPKSAGHGGGNPGLGGISRGIT